MRLPRTRSLSILAGIALSTGMPLFAQTLEEAQGYLRHPQASAFGIVCTDNLASRIYLESGGVSRTLVEARGSGNGVVIDPAGTFAGFKYIDANGLQSPAVIDLANGTIHALHGPVARAGQVSFAANGARAYTIGEDLLIEQDGSLRRIPLGTYANLAPISPDGNSVVFNDGGSQLWLLDLATNERRQITDGSMGFCEPIWSPASNHLFFRTLAGEGFLFDRSTGSSVPLGQAHSASWSPSGDAILFHRIKTDGPQFVDSDLFIASASDGHAYPLTSTSHIAEMDAAFSRDGASVLFQDYRSSSVVQRRIERAENRWHILQETPLLKITRRPDPPSAQFISGLRKVSGGTTLDIPYVHQTIDTPDWHNGNSSCAPTAAIMVLAYYGILPPWETYSSTLYVHLNSWGNYVSGKYYFRGVDYSWYQAGDAGGNAAWGGYGFMWVTGSPYTRMRSYYTLHGLTATQTESTPFTTALNEVQAGRPFTICALLTPPGHLVLAHGVGVEEHTLVFNDPYGDKNQGYSNYYGKNVQYDWPTYNNGFQNLNTVAWGIAASYTAPSVVDTLIDDLQFAHGFYLHAKGTASMTMWRDRLNGVKGHCWTTLTTDTDTCYATWTAPLPQPGIYEVEAFVPPTVNGKAQYRITHAGGTAVTEIDQSVVMNSWVSLGMYQFNAPAIVRLGSGSTVRGQTLGFDAIRWTSRGSTAVGESDQVPAHLMLGQNFPNPFNPETVIRYQVPVISGQSSVVSGQLARRLYGGSAVVSLKIYDALGRETATLAEGVQLPGMYRVVWNGAASPSGVYLYRLQIRSASGIVTQETRKMLLLK